MHCQDIGSVAHSHSLPVLSGPLATGKVLQNLPQVHDMHALSDYYEVIFAQYPNLYLSVWVAVL